MFSVSDFVAKYETHTDEELMGMHLNIDGYSEEAKEALEIVIEKKGGLDTLEQRLQEKKKVADEVKRIAKDVKEMGMGGADASFLITVTKSDILSDEKVKEVIDAQYASVEAEIENKKIKPRTVIGGIVGGGIASVVGGILWGLQMIYSQRIFYLFGVGLVLLCYAIIKVSTRQNKENKVVLIATILSVIVALLIGSLLYEIIGYKR